MTKIDNSITELAKAAPKIGKDGKEISVYNFVKRVKGGKDVNIEVTRRQMLSDLRTHYGSKDWWKELGFKKTTQIYVDDLHTLYSKAFGLDRKFNNDNSRKFYHNANKFSNKFSNLKQSEKIYTAHKTKITNLNNEFSSNTEVGREMFEKMKSDIASILIDYSVRSNSEWDHDKYTDKPVDRLSPVEFMRWLSNVKVRMEKEIAVTGNLQLEVTYKEMGEVWSDTETYAIDIVKGKIQVLLSYAGIDVDYAKKDLRKYAGIVRTLRKLKREYPEKYMTVIDKIEGNRSKRGLVWYVNNPRETLTIYIESFYKSPVDDFFSPITALKLSPAKTRERTLTFMPNFNAEGYGGIVGKLYEDLLDLAFRVKLGIIDPTTFKNKFNKLAEGSGFTTLVNVVDVKGLNRFNSLSKKGTDKYEDIVNKPNINRAMMKLHCFNVVSLILEHFGIAQKQVLMRDNMIQAIMAFEKNTNWIKREYNKDKLSKVTDRQIEVYYHKIFNLNFKEKNKAIAKFQNVGFATQKWAPVDYILSGKPISLKRQNDIKTIKLKSGGSISGDNNDMATILRDLLRLNHTQNPDKSILNVDLQKTLHQLITEVLFRNNHYMIIVTNKQLAVFDFSDILTNIDVNSFRDVSTFVNMSGSLSLDNKFKMKFNTIKPINLTLYSLSAADNIITKLNRGEAIRNGVKMSKSEFSSKLRQAIKGKSSLGNALFQLKIDFRRGKENADLTFLLDGQANINDIIQLENKSFMPDFEDWVDAEII